MLMSVGLREAALAGSWVGTNDAGALQILTDDMTRMHLILLLLKEVDMANTVIVVCNMVAVEVRDAADQMVFAVLAKTLLLHHPPSPHLSGDPT